MTLQRLAALLLVPLSACAPFPDVGRLDPATGDVPALLPIDDLLAEAGTFQSDPGPGVAARAARLKAKAAAIGSTTTAP
jgi:hypothetical protein